MPTLKRRLNISLSSDMDAAIQRLAQRDKLPQARKAVDLILAALEIEEDRVWDELARHRDAGGARFVSHKKAWV